MFPPEKKRSLLPEESSTIVGLLYQKLRDKPETEMRIKRLIGMIFFHILNILKNKKKRNLISHGVFAFGRLGIRTLDTVARIHVLQTCAFDHSANLPFKFALI